MMRNSVRLCWLLLGVLLLIGCGPAQESLFEHDHALPAHWPSDPDDAATKIRARLSALNASESDRVEENNREQLHHELIDLIEWVPEIAGDTDIPEADWNAINDASLLAATELKKSESISPSVEAQLQSLSDLLEQHFAKVKK